MVPAINAIAMIIAMIIATDKGVNEVSEKPGRSFKKVSLAT